MATSFGDELTNRPRRRDDQGDELTSHPVYILDLLSSVYMFTVIQPGESDQVTEIIEQLSSYQLFVCLFV